MSELEIRNEWSDPSSPYLYELIVQCEINSNQFIELKRCFDYSEQFGENEWFDHRLADVLSYDTDGVFHLGVTDDPTLS